MNIEEAQRKFYELHDQWKIYHEAAQKLRGEVTQAFADVAKSGKTNPPLGLLAMLESMEQAEQRIQKKIDELIGSLD